MSIKGYGQIFSFLPVGRDDQRVEPLKGKIIEAQRNVSVSSCEGDLAECPR